MCRALTEMCGDHFEVGSQRLDVGRIHFQQLLETVMELGECGL
jgi:hypothetical protein